jgi:hypothetical protein
VPYAINFRKTLWTLSAAAIVRKSNQCVHRPATVEASGINGPFCVDELNVMSLKEFEG